MQNDNFKNRPLILVANSSWYLLHYRKQLIEELNKKGEKVITISPVDIHSKHLSAISVFIPWNISRNNNGLISLLISFVKYFFIVRALKPKIVHSHTLKANFIVSLVSSIFGIPTVLSFTGFGILSKSSRFKFKLLQIIILAISFFSKRTRVKKLNFHTYFNRTFLIFQNKIELNKFSKLAKNFPRSNCKLIYGSGVPKNYNVEFRNKWFIHNDEKPICTFIYSARLLKSKGIEVFLKIAEELKDHNFLIFGIPDKLNPDSLSIDEIRKVDENYKNVKYKGFIHNPLLNLDVDFPILLVPSLYGEGLPRSICEAALLGIPSIISENASVEIFKSDLFSIAKENSFNDYLYLFDNLINMYEKNILKQRLSEIRTFVYENFTEESIVEQTIEIYNQFNSYENVNYLLKNQIKNQENIISS